jgi:serine/threonine protein kinase
MASPEGLGEGCVFADRYRVLRRIGAGGMGAVYEVLQLETQRHRALKVLLPALVSDPDARQRFALEATITANLQSEQLVEVVDAGIDRSSGCPFIVMELLRGQSLGEFLAAGSRLTPAQALACLREVARGLEQTHAAGIVHRDIKPDNLFLCARDDGALRVKLLDFGIAKLAAFANNKSRNTVNIGTPLYMAPEQFGGGGLSAQTDLYSLGHVAFELLTGESYWEPEVRETPNTLALLKRMEGPLPEPASLRARRLGVNVGRAFDAWFERATARKPEARFAAASELCDRFAQAIGLAPAHSVAIAKEAPRALLLGLGVSAAVVVALGLVLLLGEPSSAEEREGLAASAEQPAAGQASSQPTSAPSATQPAAVSSASVSAVSLKSAATSGRPSAGAANKANCRKSLTRCR